MADENDPLTELAEVLRDAGARVYFDSGNNCERPCTFCGTRPAPTHKVVRIGTYHNGDPLRRPVCGQCMPVVEAIQAGERPLPAALPANACPDCLRPMWRIGSDFNFDETKHCLAAHVRSRPGTPNHDLIACLERTRDRLQAERQRTIAVLKKAGIALDDAAAMLVSVEVDHG